MNPIRRELIKMAQNAPLNGYVYSGNFGVIHLKEEFNKSDYYIVEILEKLLAEGEIRELEVNYDTDDRHILSYWFK